MKLEEYRMKKRNLRIRARKKLMHLELWINEGKQPHPFVRYALDLPRTIDEAIDEARDLSFRIWRPVDNEKRSKHALLERYLEIARLKAEIERLTKEQNDKAR